MPGKLVGTSPNQLGRVYWLDTTRPATVGRVPGNDIVLESEPSVSARHALLVFTPPHFSVEDLGSANGTFVNGERVEGHAPLRHEDTLQLGDARFRFLVEPQAHRVEEVRPAASGPSPPAAGRPASPVAVREIPQKDRVTAGVLAIVLGALGVHHFYMNRTGWGLAFLFFTICTGFWGSIITGPVGLVQGILYLVSSQREFEQKYLAEGRFF